jgi:prepilin-type N-terminal cleavage/methylation domain-containing protein
MTLLEVSVALAIAGVALASGAAVLGFLADQNARPTSEALVAASAVRTTLRDWTSQARLATEGDAELRGRPATALVTRPFAGASATQLSLRDDASDELEFVTAAPTEVSSTGTIVRLHVVRDPNVAEHGLIAELRPWRRNGTPVTRVLDADVTTLRVRYLSSLFGQRGWIDSWVSTSVLPAALEIRLGFESPVIPSERLIPSERSESRDLLTASRDLHLRAAHALLATPMLVPLASRQ